MVDDLITHDLSVLHPGILFHPIKWSVTSEGWKVHFACCIHCIWRLYTLLLGTRQQPSSTSSVRRGGDVAGLCLYTLLRWMQVYDNWQVTCNQEQDGR